MSEDIASIGFKVDTSDIERGNVALDALASKGEAVDKSVSQVEAAASKTSKSLDNLGRSVHGVNMGGLGGAAQTAATGMGAAGKAAESGATGVKRMADVLGGFSRDTSKAADALGLYASSTKNAIDHQRELERILDRANPASAAARQLSEEVQTLNRALREGAIGNDTYRASMRNAFDEAEKAAGGVSKVGTAASMVTGLLTKLAGAAAVAFSFGKFISETIAAEQAQAQLQAVLKSTGESAGWTSDQLNAMAQGLASKSIFSVDQIKAAETRLLSYTGIVGQQFPRAMQAVIDMSSRMGMDVTSAAEQIGRALDIPSQGLTALTRQGFRFTEEQKEMVKQLEETGRVAEAQAIVLSAVESSYGGAAEAARGTFGGALKELQNSINDLMTGDSSVPALTAGVDALTNIVKNAGAVLGEMKVSTDGVAGSISAAALVGNGFSILLETVAVLAVNVAYVLSGVGREIGGIAAQGAALMRFDFTAAAAIRREMVSDAEAARKAVDQTTQNILNARAKLAEKPAINIGAPNAETMAKGAAEAQEKALTAATNARTKAINDLLGVNQKYQEKLTELQGLEKSGALTHAEYVQAVSKLATATYAATDAGKAAAEASKAGAKARDEAAKATEREAQSYTRFVNSIREKIAAQELELAGGDKLSQSQKVRLQLEKMIADGRLASSRASSEELKTDLDRLKANELEIAGRKAAIDAVNSQRAAYIALSNEAATQNKSIESGNTSLREQIATMGLTNQQIRDRTIELNRATIAEKEQQLARLQSGYTNTREQAALEEEIRLLKERNGLLSDQGVKEQYVAAQQEMTDTWTSIDRTAHDVFVNIFEDGAGTFKRLGQTLKAALLDMLYQMTVKRWIINIGASLGATGGIFAAGQAMAGQGGGGILGLASNASSAYNLATGGFGSMLFGNSIAYGAMVPGLSMGGAQAAMLAAQTGEFGLAGATATASAGGAGAGGFGALLSNPVTIAIGALAMLGLSGAFSRKHEQHNLQGTFGGATGFEGNWHDYYRGGLFRSSKTVDTPLEADFLKGLQDAWNAQEAAVTSYAQALGLATDSIAGFTYDVNIKLKDLDPKAGDYQQQLMARVADAIKAGSNEMAQQLIGSWDTVQETVTRHVQQFGDDGFSTVEETITRQTYVASEFAREGESAIDTLTRLGSSLQAVNSVFDTLGYTLLSASLASGDLASSIIDAFGGQERFGAQTGSYFQNYYSAAERRATLQRQLTDEMDRLGFVLPATRDGFRRLVEAQRLTTTEGQQTYAALIGLSGAFAEITQSSEEAAQALSDATDRAFADLSRYIGQQRELWQTALQAAQTLVAEARDIRDTASGAARELWGQSDDTRAMLAVQGRATIDRMLSGLRATGALPDADELRRAIEDARGGLDMSQYATVAEYELAQALLAGQLSEIGDLAGEQMTVAEKQVAAAEAQIKQLDQTLDFWREQIDLMRDTFDVITNLDAGIAVLADAVRAEQAAKAEAEARAAATPTSPGGGGWGGWGGGGGGGPTYTATPTTIYASDEDEIADAVARYAAVGLRAYAYLNPSGTWSVSPGLAPYDETRLMDLRQYASGGLHSGGLRLVGERGPELEVTGPARYWSHEQTRSMFRGGGGDQTALLEELQALRAEIRELRAAAASGAKAAQDTHNLLDRVSAGGNALLVEAA